ncbi:YHYH domain-containing protein [Frigidibacter sp. MR17.14]
MKLYVAITTLATLVSTAALAHGGGLNSQGCHNQTSNGTYHCH